MSGRARRRWTIGLVVLAGLAAVAGANAHLLYVAVTSQPDCVAHVRQGEARPGQFAVPKSAC
jgi:hypothetical protein